MGWQNAFVLARFIFMVSYDDTTEREYIFYFKAGQPLFVALPTLLFTRAACRHKAKAISPAKQQGVVKSLTLFVRLVTLYFCHLYDYIFSVAVRA